MYNSVNPCSTEYTRAKHRQFQLSHRPSTSPWPVLIAFSIILSGTQFDNQRFSGQRLVSLRLFVTIVFICPPAPTIPSCVFLLLFLAKPKRVEFVVTFLRSTGTNNVVICVNLLHGSGTTCWHRTLRFDWCLGWRILEIGKRV
jgi:hypothetical protein